MFFCSLGYQACELLIRHTYIYAFYLIKFSQFFGSFILISVKHVVLDLKTKQEQKRK